MKKGGSPPTTCGDDGKEEMGMTEKRRWMADEEWWEAGEIDS